MSTGPTFTERKNKGSSRRRSSQNARANVDGAPAVRLLAPPLSDEAEALQRNTSFSTSAATSSDISLPTTPISESQAPKPSRSGNSGQTRPGQSEVCWNSLIVYCNRACTAVIIILLIVLVSLQITLIVKVNRANPRDQASLSTSNDLNNSGLAGGNLTRTLTVSPSVVASASTTTSSSATTTTTLTTTSSGSPHASQTASPSGSLTASPSSSSPTASPSSVPSPNCSEGGSSWRASEQMGVGWSWPVNETARWWFTFELQALPGAQLAAGGFELGPDLYVHGPPPGCIQIQQQSLRPARGGVCPEHFQLWKLEMELTLSCTPTSNSAWLRQLDGECVRWEAPLQLPSSPASPLPASVDRPEVQASLLSWRVVRRSVVQDGDDNSEAPFLLEVAFATWSELGALTPSFEQASAPWSRSEWNLSETARGLDVSAAAGEPRAQLWLAWAGSWLCDPSGSTELSSTQTFAGQYLFEVAGPGGGSRVTVLLAWAGPPRCPDLYNHWWQPASQLRVWPSAAAAGVGIPAAKDILFLQSLDNVGAAPQGGQQGPGPAGSGAALAIDAGGSFSGTCLWALVPSLAANVSEQLVPALCYLRDPCWNGGAVYSLNLSVAWAGRRSSLVCLAPGALPGAMLNSSYALLTLEAALWLQNDTAPLATRGMLRMALVRPRGDNNNNNDTLFDSSPSPSPATTTTTTTTATAVWDSSFSPTPTPPGLGGSTPALTLSSSLGPTTQGQTSLEARVGAWDQWLAYALAACFLICCCYQSYQKHHLQLLAKAALSGLDTTNPAPAGKEKQPLLSHPEPADLDNEEDRDELHHQPRPSQQQQQLPQQQQGGASQPPRSISSLSLKEGLLSSLDIDDASEDEFYNPMLGVLNLDIQPSGPGHSTLENQQPLQVQQEATSGGGFDNKHSPDSPKGGAARLQQGESSPQSLVGRYMSPQDPSSLGFDSISSSAEMGEVLQLEEANPGAQAEEAEATPPASPRHERRRTSVRSDEPLFSPDFLKELETA